VAAFDYFNLLSPLEGILCAYFSFFLFFSFLFVYPPCLEEPTSNDIVVWLPSFGFADAEYQQAHHSAPTERGAQDVELFWREFTVMRVQMDVPTRAIDVSLTFAVGIRYQEEKNIPASLS
jgi:hypothetical protein